jgi:transposase-like protein
MTNDLPGPIVPPAREGHSRTFSEAAKRRIVEETGRPGASLSEVARHYGIAARVLFRWKQELTQMGTAVSATSRRRFHTQARSLRLHRSDRLCAKRLEQGRFQWPATCETGGTVMLTSSQVSMLIECIDCAPRNGDRDLRRQDELAACDRIASRQNALGQHESSSEDAA